MNEIREVKKSDKKEVTVESVQARVNDMAAKIRRLSSNWKRFAAVHLGSDEHVDGKLNGGFVPICILTAIAALSLIAGSVFAATWDISAPGTGTCKAEDAAGTFTMTVDVMKPTTLYLGGTLITATAANLNSGVASSVAAVATPNANGGTNVVVCTLADLGGNTLAVAGQASAFTFFISDSAFGVPAAVAGNIVVSGGYEIKELTDKAVYTVLTATNGTVTVTVTDTPGGTNYFHCVTGGGIVATPTTMAFNVP